MFNLFRKKEPIHIFYGVDDNYTDYLIVAMTSVLLSADKDDLIHFHILASIFNKGYDDNNNIIYKNTREKFEKDIEELKKIKKCSIEIIDVNPSIVSNLPTKWYITQTAYLRYLIPVLKPEIDKGIYLDVDTLVLKSLKNLYKIDLENNYAAVVEDMLDNEDKRIRLEKFCINNYFNSGMLLMNLKRWREENLTEIFLRDTKYSKFMDQDVLNCVFGKDVLYIDYKYNWLPKNFRGGLNDNAVIVHFAGAFKPWTNGFERTYWFFIYDSIVKKSPIKEIKRKNLVMHED